MKKLIYTLTIAAFTFSGCTSQTSDTQEEGHDDAHEHPASEASDEHEGHDMAKEGASESEGKPKSPHTSAMAMINDAHVHIDYSSPRVRGRVIFGGLVAYDEVWVSGAHRATWLDTNKELLINGQVLPKGKYGFFTIPGKEEWTVILNKNWDQHGADEYSADEDVMRFSVTPEELSEVKEELTYTVAKDDDGGQISLEWEKVRISFDFKVNE
ncbi:DUF2911 domain-containing protein [Ekhidna sp.]|jgi:hypothetical protein|uniref:DUF2911 domain-containing protein n=1 Tax=Ekhidna sp. TaxID=2608089 RepID=UPI0032988F21